MKATPQHSARLRSLIRADQVHQALELMASLELVGVDLSHMDLSSVDLRGALLSGARFNEYTRWPTGFDPFDPWYGMRKV